MVYGTKTGLKTALSQDITESSAGIPGTVEYNDRFGGELISADFNADGYADLAILADNEFVTCAGQGTIIIVFGAKLGLSSKAFSLSVPRGESIKGNLQTGDLNRDGIPDLVWNTFQAPYLLVGSTSLATRHSLKRLDPPNSDQLNVHAALVGDVNGDGWLDITMPYISAFTGWHTAIAVSFGGPSGLQPPQIAPSGDDAQNSNASMGMGDVNGDGQIRPRHRKRGLRRSDPCRRAGHSVAWRHHPVRVP